MRRGEAAAALGLDEAAVARRRAYFGITDDDLGRAAAVRDLARRHDGEFVDALYRFILGHPASAAFLVDEATIARVKELQRRHFHGLFAGVCDLAYVAERVRVGAAHEAIRMPAGLYLGAYAVYLELLRGLLDRALPPEEARRTAHALERLVLFDAALAMDAYVAAAGDSLRRHQAAVRELSTPVIRIFERILLLPLVGTIDTGRAEQLMETLLVRVGEERARVVIIDISGVPVVDTKVAEHLLLTTNAVRLLGAETVIAGLSPTIAKTIVQLGLPLPADATRGRLQEAIELALRRTGRDVLDRGGPR